MDGKFYPNDYTNFFIVSDLFLLTLAYRGLKDDVFTCNESLDI